MTSKTFCAAPWFAVRLDWNGSYRPCGQLDTSKSKFTGQKEYNLSVSDINQWMTSEYVQYLKEELDVGNCIEECDGCWKQESSGFKSLRQKINDTVTCNRGQELDQTWVHSFLKKSSYQKYKLVFADVKLSNICNFSCAMCSPVDSSKIFDQWKNQLDNKFVLKFLSQDADYFNKIIEINQNKKGYQYLTDILNQSIYHLKILGGEPLLDKELLSILSEVESSKKTKISLHFVTNGSQDLISIVNKLPGYKNISFTVSLEGVGSIQDYVRQGSDWTAIEKNILNAHSQGILINIHYTIQAMSILKIKDLINWCNNHKLNLGFGVLTDPDYLSVAVLPPHIKSIIIEQLNNDGHMIEEGLKKLLLDMPYDLKNYQNFLEYVNWYEKNSNIKLLNICPELSA